MQATAASSGGRHPAVGPGPLPGPERGRAEQRLGVRDGGEHRGRREQPGHRRPGPAQPGQRRGRDRRAGQREHHAGDRDRDAEASPSASSTGRPGKNAIRVPSGVGQVAALREPAEVLDVPVADHVGDRRPCDHASSSATSAISPRLASQAWTTIRPVACRGRPGRRRREPPTAAVAGSSAHTRTGDDGASSRAAPPARPAPRPARRRSGRPPARADRVVLGRRTSRTTMTPPALGGQPDDHRQPVDPVGRRRPGPGSRRGATRWPRSRSARPR